jgi:N-acetylmuramoyl-L-alanine amidase
VLVALPGALPGRGGSDLPVIELGRSNGVANDFVKIELDPGWQLTRRTLNGSAQGHLYLSNSQSLEAVVAQAGGARPAAPVAAAPTPTNPSPASRPPILGGSSLPSPGTTPRPGAAPAPSGGSGEATSYQVIVPSASPLVQSRVRQVASDAFMADVNGRRVIQAGLFQERGRADQLVSQLSGRGIEAEIVEGRRAVPPPSSTPSPSNETYYQVIVPDSGSDTRDRVNAVESGAFRTQRDGRSVIQAGRFRERDRAEQLQRRLSDANLQAQIVEGSGPAPIASAPPGAPRPSGSTPPVPRARQGQLTVVLDPGHGGGDPGAIGIGGIREKDITLAISRRIQQSLQDKGINALITRADDTEVELQPRVDYADRANADVFVSVHANSISLSRPDVSGLETYYYSSGLRLAQTIHNSLLERTTLDDRGVRRARFYVLVNTSMPAVLVETGFVTGSDDAARFRDPAALNGIADGITAGILQYLGVQ